jgi:hypothetical protein
MKYTDFAAFARALDTGKVPGVILWQGASAIDGTPIVLVANRFDGASGNDKTGAMVQTWILPDPRAAGIDVNGARPAKIMAWLKETGARSICGDCPHAWQYNDATGEYEKGSCYVREYQAPAATLGGVYRGAYPIAGVDFPAEWIWRIGQGRNIRAGSYGDPAACPADVWRDFLAMASGRTGYTHMWKSAHAQARRHAWRMRDLLMASCDSAAEYRASIDAGFRAFYVVPQDAIDKTASPYSVGSHIDGAMMCPASSEFEAFHGRKTSCEKCGACSGAGGKGARMPSVFIPAHGATANRVAENNCPAAARMIARIQAGEFVAD